MMVLITYDVNTETKEGRRRLRKVAKQCQNYGQRVQFSVFECLVNPGQFKKIRHSLVEIIDEETDSLRFYFLGNRWKNRVEHIGAKPSMDLEGTLIA